MELISRKLEDIMTCEINFKCVLLFIMLLCTVFFLAVYVTDLIPKTSHNDIALLKRI